MFCTQVTWKLGCWGVGGKGRWAGEAGGRADRPPAQTCTRTSACLEAVRPTWLRPGPLKDHPGKPSRKPIHHGQQSAFFPPRFNIRSTKMCFANGNLVLASRRMLAAKGRGGSGCVNRHPQARAPMSRNAVHSDGDGEPSWCGTL